MIQRISMYITGPMVNTSQSSAGRRPSAGMASSASV